MIGFDCPWHHYRLLASSYNTAMLEHTLPAVPGEFSTCMLFSLSVGSVPLIVCS